MITTDGLGEVRSTQGDKMRSTLRNITTVAAALSALTAAGVVVAPAASAAASYNGACGSGYKVVNSARIGGMGTVFLTYNSANGYNCAITIRDTSDSTPDLLMVRLERTGDIYSAKVDSGNYTTYAGPVYVSGAGSCMSWRGVIVRNETAYNNGGDRTNCG